VSARPPRVSLIVPMFNEEEAIGACLESVAAQDYPADRMEVLVIDGESSDRSPEIVRSFQGRIPGLRLLRNPRRLTPTSLNLGIREAQGEVWLRMDSHSTMAPDYVRTCVETLRRTGADNVGGTMRPVGRGRVGEAVATATCSRFGIGGGRFHHATEEQPADTVYLGCYPLATLRRLGGYDESMIINEDDELNFRLTRGGGRIWLNPAIRSWYTPRGSLPGLWRQYYRYGRWKVRLMQKHRAVLSLRHLVPGGFVAGLVAGLAAAPFTAWGKGLLLAVAAPYAVANLAASVAGAARAGWRQLTLLPPVFATLHLAYGTGFLAGMVRFLLLRRDR
jgi:glycosyltransferase involved in cell wall biosynthesis